MKSQQPIGTLTSTPPNREKFIAFMISGWFITGAIGIILSWALGDDLIGDSLGWIVGGGIGGLGTGHALAQLDLGIQRQQIKLLIIGWAVSLAPFEIITGAIGDSIGAPLSWSLSWSLTGAMGGGVTGYVVAQVKPCIQKKSRLVMILGFAVGWAIGGTVAGALEEALSWAIGWIIAGATHSSVILWCLRKPANFDIKA